MEKRTPKWVIILIIILGFIMIIFPTLLSVYFICFESFESNYEISKNGIVMIDDGELMIDKDVESYYDKETNTYYIIGYVENLSDHSKSMEISYKLYDKEKNVIGMATAYIEEIDKKEKWKFKATYQEIDAKGVSDYKLESIYTY